MRTALVFFVWLIAATFAIRQEGASPENIAIALIALIAWQLPVGFRLDKAAQKQAVQQMEKERLERGKTGEQAWQEQQAAHKKQEKTAKRMYLAGLLIDLAVATAFIAIGTAVAGDANWLRGKLPKFLAFLVLFYVPAIWLGLLPIKIREKRVLEAVLVWPFIILAFSPLISLQHDMLMAPCILFSIGWVFAALGMGYMLQERRKRDICHVPATAKVIGNVKSTMRAPGKRRGFTPTYQPVLEYDAEGAVCQVVCDNGQPHPLPLGKTYCIYYQPEKPEQFRFDESNKPLAEKYGAITFIGAGALLVIAAVVLICILCYLR